MNLWNTYKILKDVSEFMLNMETWHFTRLKYKWYLNLIKDKHNNHAAVSILKKYQVEIFNLTHIFSQRKQRTIQFLQEIKKLEHPKYFPKRK